MIILREKQFGPDDRRGGRDRSSGQGKYYTEEEISKIEKEAVEDFKNSAEGKAKIAEADRIAKEEAKVAREKAAAAAEKRAKRIKQFKRYTGLDSLEEWLKKRGEGIKEVARKNEKLIRGASIGTIGLAAAGGLAYGGSKIYENAKNKKSNEDLRKKVRGYDSSKKK